MTKFIAEVSSNHNRSLKRCLEFVKVAKKIGCYAIKFQLFKIDNLFSREVLEKSAEHRKRKMWELPYEFIPVIKKECMKRKIKFGCTPFDLDAVRFLKKYVDFYKISSYEILWNNLLEECAKSKKPVIFSTGMANLNEILEAKKILKKNGCKDITTLHCISEYPADIKSSNLHFFKILKEKLKIKVGWSDHTKNELFLAFLCNHFDIEYLEFHLDLDKKGYEYGPGHCWLPNEIEKIINFQKKIKLIRDNKSYIKKFSKVEKKERLWRTDPQDGLRPFRALR
tara:strand:+ start:1296 stop:2141 length:846 start_codon:yes stop_codon:yes gene_type:complete